MTRSGVLLAFAVALVACGGDDRPQGVPVGEAPLPQSVGDDWDAPRAPGDSSDLLALPPLGPDSLRADSLARDTLAALDSFPRRRPPPRRPPPTPPDPRGNLDWSPDFAPAWAAFLDGDAPTALRSSAARALRPPFGDAVGALSPRDFRREGTRSDGTRREAVVRVGFDASGDVVPQETAVRDSTVRIQFDVVDGAYRLTDLRFSG